MEIALKKILQERLAPDLKSSRFTKMRNAYLRSADKPFRNIDTNAISLHYILV